MRNAILPVLILSVAIGIASAQPTDGDLILTYSDFKTFTTGAVLVVDPATHAWSTLATPPTGYGMVRMRMAADNTNLVGMTISSMGPPARRNNHVVQVSPSGVLSTVAVIPGLAVAMGIELDHDGWILAVRESPSQEALWALQGKTLSTLFSMPRTQGWGYFMDMTIDRDPGAPPYVVGRRWGSLTTVTPIVQGMDRKGIVTTIYSGTRGSGLGMYLGCMGYIDMNPATGDYLICAGPSGGATSLSLVATMSKDGSKITTLQTASTITFPYASKFCQDGTAWIANIVHQNGIALHKLDIGENKIVWSQAIQTPAATFPTGIEVYGSRTLVCSQTSPAAVNVSVKSHHGFVVPGRTQYALAASMARRPGLNFVHGERLNLDVTDPLFTISALNLAPSIFQDFQGKLAQNRNATAKVNIPAEARGLGLSVFVAGVIYNQSGIFQVTNTHWFVL